MKNKLLIISAILFCLLINTTYFWEAKMGMASIPVFLFLCLAWLLLVIAVFWQLVAGLREKSIKSKRLLTIFLLLFVVITSFTWPAGIINFDSFEADAVLVAEGEGAANCMTRLKLKSDHTFTEKIVCFGISETTGTFSISNDTIWFENIKHGRNDDGFYQFALIKPPDKNINDRSRIVKYKTTTDSVGHQLWISKNELHKLNAIGSSR